MPLPGGGFPQPVQLLHERTERCQVGQRQYPHAAPGLQPPGQPRQCRWSQVRRLSRNQDCYLISTIFWWQVVTKAYSTLFSSARTLPDKAYLACNVIGDKLTFLNLATAVPGVGETEPEISSFSPS